MPVIATLPSAEVKQSLILDPLFTARRNASAVYAVVVCLSVCPPQADIVSKLLDCFLARGSFLWPILHRVIRNSRYFKVKKLPSGTLPQT